MSLNIRRAIIARHLTNKEVAARLNITTTTLQSFLGPDATPSLSTLKRIAEVLQCDVVELFDEPLHRSLPRGHSAPPDRTTAPIVCPHCGTLLQTTLKEVKNDET